MQVVLNHPSRGAQGQFLKSSKGKLDENITVILFLEEKPHFMKVFSKHIFSILKYGKAQQCEWTKLDAHWIKNYLGIWKRKIETEV